MCVGIGSFSDPNEAQGLAHFLGFDIYLIQAQVYFLLIYQGMISVNMFNYEFLATVLQNTCCSWGVMNFQMKMRCVWLCRFLFMTL